MRAFNLAQPREEVAEVADVDADGVPCRLPSPPPTRSRVVIVHLHGGGFVFNDIDVHDGVCRRLANRARRRVLSIDYRTPPEHRFPAATRTSTPRSVAGRQGPAGWAIHGDSAGANLALVGALRNPGRFAAVVLIYPFLDPTASFASFDLGEESGFGRAEASWYWEQYAASAADYDDPDLAPLRSDRLGELPPTFVATARVRPAARRGGGAGPPIVESGVETVASAASASTTGSGATSSCGLRAAAPPGGGVHRPAPVMRPRRD